MGMWAPVHDDEWDGDIPLEVVPQASEEEDDSRRGKIVFSGDTLPWKVGTYEVCINQPHSGIPYH